MLVRTPALASAVLLVGCAFVALAAPGVAGEKKKAKKDAKPHIEFRATYEQALLESRIRNVPVFVSRHKDF
jgi:hypothetical protein